MFNKLKRLQVADSYECCNNKIAVLIDTNTHYNIVTGRIKRLKNTLLANATLFGWCLHGYMESNNELFSIKIIVEEKDRSDESRIFLAIENLRN